MIALSLSSEKFPKGARLLKRSDFRFRPYSRQVFEDFTCIFSASGSGRLGISVSKKVLRNATCRNRVRRVLRESFRKVREELLSMDVHVIANPPLAEHWREINERSVQQMFRSLSSRYVEPRRKSNSSF